MGPSAICLVPSVIPSESSGQHFDVVLDANDPSVRLRWLREAREEYNMKYSYEAVSFNKVSSFKSRIFHADAEGKPINKLSLFNTFALGHKTLQATHSQLTEKILMETIKVQEKLENEDEDSSYISASSLADKFDD